MSCVFAKQKRQRVAKFATLLQCTKKSLMGTRFKAAFYSVLFSLLVKSGFLNQNIFARCGTTSLISMSVVFTIKS